MSLSLTAIATEFDELPQKPNSDPRWLFRVSIFDALAGRGAIQPTLQKVTFFAPAHRNEFASQSAVGACRSSVRKKYFEVGNVFSTEAPAVALQAAD
jgi:hypothetical protein